MKRPRDKSSTVRAAIAMVGTVRTKTLVMLVPRRMREVAPRKRQARRTDLRHGLRLPTPTHNRGFRRASHSQLSRTDWRHPRMRSQFFWNLPYERIFARFRRRRAQDHAD